jgi:uncharacterized protein YdhG (YjbR/CyaY superfamily)
MNDHFEKAAPSVRAAYDAILKTARLLGPVREDPKKTSIHLMRATAFAGVTVRREALILTLKSNEPIESERVHRAEQLSAKRWYNEIRVASPRDVDAELREWIAASYAMSDKPRTARAMPSGHTTIDEYLAQLEPAKRKALESLRRAIREAAPGAEECLSYQMPAFRMGDKVFAWMGVGANHYALYPGAAAIRQLKDALKSYETSKGTVRFALDRPLPATLVHRLVKAGIADKIGGRVPARGKTRAARAKSGAVPAKRKTTRAKGAKTASGRRKTRSRKP